MAKFERYREVTPGPTGQPKASRTSTEAIRRVASRLAI